MFENLKNSKIDSMSEMYKKKTDLNLRFFKFETCSNSTRDPIASSANIKMCVLRSFFFFFLKIITRTLI